MSDHPLPAGDYVPNLATAARPDPFYTGQGPCHGHHHRTDCDGQYGHERGAHVPECGATSPYDFADRCTLPAGHGMPVMMDADDEAVSCDHANPDGGAYWSEVRPRYADVPATVGDANRSQIWEANQPSGADEHAGHSHDPATFGTSTDHYPDTSGLDLPLNPDLLPAVLAPDLVHCDVHGYSHGRGPCNTGPRSLDSFPGNTDHERLAAALQSNHPISLPSGTRLTGDGIGADFGVMVPETPLWRIVASRALYRALEAGHNLLDRIDRA